MKGYYELGKSIGGNGCVRIIRNAKHIKELKAFVNNNAHENLYMSVYTFGETSKGVPIYDSAVCDRLFVEIDSEDHSLLDNRTYRAMQKLIKWCKEESYEGGEIRPQIYFSGRSGYHIIFTFEKPLLDLKGGQLIKHVIKKIAEKSGVAIDLQANNGFSQMRRIPNTLNHKSGLYCIPLTVDEAYNYGPDKIMQLAKKPRRTVKNDEGFSPYFAKVLDHLRLAEINKPPLRQRLRTDAHNRRALTDADKIISRRQDRQPIRPCIKKMMAQQNPTFQERTFIACEMIRCGMTDSDLHSVFINYKKYDRAITQGHLEKLREKEIYAPSCDTLKMHGLCTEELHNANR